MRNDCITISEIEVVFYGELTFGAADLCIQCSYIKIVLDSNFQSISFEQKG